ncbi:hypothetical protein LMG8526HA_02559 [Lactococcus lactis]|nr:hypothetical protein [Lactococcus lactis]
MLKLYLFDRLSGVMRKGQVNDAGNWYLFNRSSGVMMYGLQTDINGKTYYFNNAGKMVYGTATLEKTNYKLIQLGMLLCTLCWKYRINTQGLSSL